MAHAHASRVAALAVVLPLAILLALAGCGAAPTPPTVAPTATPPASPTATRPPTPTAVPPRSTAAIRCDVVPTVAAFAWLDADGDGRQGAGEPPLAGVTFVVKDADHVGRSDAAGYAHFRFPPGCTAPAPSAYTLLTAAPPGYRLTTPAEIQVATLGEGRFGFAPR